MTTTAWVVLGIANIPVYWGLGWVLFRTWANFGESIYFWFKPDMWSFIDGEWGADLWAELKLGFWCGGCAAAVYGEAYLLDTYLL